MRRLLTLAVFLACLGITTAAHADNAPCKWKIVPLIAVDPPPQDNRAAALAPTPFAPYGDIDWILGNPVLPVVPVWGWRSVLDADPWIIAGTCKAYSYHWGFPSVSASLSGAGCWKIERLHTCCTPREDIEVHVRQQFHVEGELNADEKLEIRGALRFWCSSVRSSHNPPKAVHSIAAGGVSLDDDYDEEDRTVDVELGGLSFQLAAASGGSRADDPSGFDDGCGGTSPEYVNTSTHISCTMDLDTADTCSGEIRDVWWYVNVMATCDGCCMRRQTMLHKDSYPDQGD